MRLSLFLAYFLTLVPNAVAGDIYERTPVEPSPDKHYLFYVHGRFVESEGVDAISPKFGRYDFRDIVSTLASGPSDVIAEVRSADTDVFAYAERLASEIRNLIAKGVPADQIAVAGFSKGGYMTLLTANELQNPSVKFIVMAGCVRAIVEGDDRNADGLNGSILSMVDAKDDLASSCKPLFDRNPQIAKREDLVFQDGSGHGFFYQADARWVDPLLRWAQE